MVTVVFGNESPKSGNSYINSLILTLTFPKNAGVTIPFGASTFSPSASQVACPSSTSNGTLDQTVLNICVANISGGIKPGAKMTITIPVTVTNVACTSASWVGQAFTGNSFSGNPFVDSSQAGSAFSQGPAAVGCDGILGCGQSFGNPASTDPGTVFGIRGLFNKDGKSNSTATCGTNVAYANTLLNADPNTNTPQTNHYKWDTNAQPNAAFSYTVNWQPVSLDQSIGGVWPAGHPKVSWASQPSSPSQYSPALACLGPVDITTPPYGLPAPYGKVVLVNFDGSIRIDVNGNVAGQSYALPVTSGGASFPIVIGPERTQVTAVAFVSSGVYDLTVNGPQGGTAPYSPQVNDPVMFTPMPIYPSGDLNYPGQQAHMCVADQEWIPDGLDAITGNLLILYSTTFIDLGDGWSSP
jgi:hypothetical protein